MTLSVFARKDLEEKLAKVSKIHPFYLKFTPFIYHLLQNL